MQHERGQPGYTDLLLYGLGAVVAFTALEALVTRGFRVPLMGGSDQVVTLGTAPAFVSVVLAITTALAVAALLRGGGAWFGAALAASIVFIVTESLEFILSEWVQERRGEPTERD